MTHVLDDEDDWIDLERGTTGKAPPPDATVTLSIFGKTGKARAWLALRGAAADWLRANGPRFKVQVGGPDANKVRIIPDALGGKFEFTDLRGVCRFSLGLVNAWPNESRDAIAATFSLASGLLVLTLPRDFAKATASVAKTPVVDRPAPVAPAARKIGPDARVTDHRTYGAMSLGEPAPGRSALDQRRAASEKK